MDQGLIPLSIMIEDHTAGMFLTSGSIRYSLTEVTGNWSRNGSLCCGHLKKSGTWTVMLLYCDADEYVDMVKAGIIDPVKVIRTALTDAAR